MSCPKDTNFKVRDEFGNIISPIVKRTSKCKGRKSFYPSFTPVINSLSVTSSIIGVYTVVYINGSNFLPPCNGDTYVNFGSFTHLPITFYSSFNISFIIPLNAISGFYDVRVVNTYNDNFSLPVGQSNPGIPNYSNSIPFKINNISYSLFGSYTVSSDSSYNTIINFTGNGIFTILQNSNLISINYIAVGGGGGGGGGISTYGGCGGGGGGGGGIAIGTFSSKNIYPILIGTGGLGGTSGTIPTNGTSGSSTQITGVISVPGGDFGRNTLSSPFGNGGNSGNGGSGGDGNLIPGRDGSNGGGGGGGINLYPTGANGGNGAISNLSVYSFGTAFGAGGGGGGGSSGELFTSAISGTGGNIYAGTGGNSNGTVGNGTANYGGGGGGGISGNNGIGYTNGGNGGSGRVILYFNN